MNKKPNNIIIVFNKRGKMEKLGKIRIGKSLLFKPLISDTDPFISS
jgi:hypothetical protein